MAKRWLIRPEISKTATSRDDGGWVYNALKKYSRFGQPSFVPPSGVPLIGNMGVKPPAGTSLNFMGSALFYFLE